MSSEWPRSKLGSAFTTMTGSTPSKANDGLFGAYIPLVKPPELLDGLVDSAEDGLSEAGAKCARTLPAESVLVSCIGNLGKVGLNKVPVAFNQQINAVLPNRTIAIPEFMFYQALSPAFRAQLESLATGTTVRIVNKSKFNEIEIVLAPLGDQRRIVAILDEAFEGIATAKAHAEKNLRNAREVFAQRREDTLEQSDGWREASLSELCEIRHGYAFEGEHFATRGEYVLLTPGSFFETGGFRDRGEKTKYFVGEIPPAFVLDEGDLLVAMTEQAAGLLGSPLLVPEGGRYLHNQRLGRVIGRASLPWTNEFFFHVFNLRRVRAEIHASASGVKVRHTSPAKIGAVRVRFPPTTGEQSAVAAALVELAEDCHRLEASYTRKLAALDELKQSLLHQAFSGQL